MQSVSLSPRELRVGTLNQLADTCRDAEIELRRSASRVRGRDARDLLRRSALELSRLAHELHTEVRLLGGDAASKSADSSGKRALYAVDSGTDAAGDEAPLAGCQVLLEGARRAYERVIVEGVPSDLEPLLRSHHEALKESLARLERLCPGVRS